MAEQFELSPDMKAVIGKDSAPWPYEVTTTSVRAFARGVGYTDPVYYDVEAARAAGYKSLPAPPTYLGTPVFIPNRSHDTFSGPIVGQPALHHELKNVLDGGTETETFEQICAGDTLTAVTRIADLKVRESPKLGKMLIVTSETRFTLSDGKLAALQRSQVIFY